MKGICVALACAMFIGCKAEVAFVSAGSGLILRSEPNQTAASLGVIPYRTKVDILEKKAESVTIGADTGSWTKVRYGQQAGWVFGGFLSSMEPNASPVIGSLVGRFPTLSLPIHDPASAWKILVEQNTLRCTPSSISAMGCSVAEVTQDGNVFKFRGRVEFAGEQPVFEAWSCEADLSQEPLLCKGGMDRGTSHNSM